MRLWVGIGIATALALGFLSPAAGAHLGPVDVSVDQEHQLAEPSGDDPACAGCEVLLTPWGNAPPVTVLESGGIVTWKAQVAQTHTATSDYPTEDKATLVQGNPYYRTDVCLHVGVTSEDPGRAKFAIRDGQLAVLYESDFDEDPANQTWVSCEEAIGLEGGAWALSYHCNTHQQFQHAALVVVPEP